MIVDDFFAYQLSGQREDEAQKRAKIAEEAERNQVPEAQLVLNEERCIHCDAVNSLVYKQQEGTQVCRECGIVAQTNIIDQTLEHRNYASELGGVDASSNRVNNVGGSRWASEQVPTTLISRSTAHGKSLNRHHHDHEATRDRNIRLGQKRIQEVAGALNLRHGDVVDQAQYYMNKIESLQIIVWVSI